MRNVKHRRGGDGEEAHAIAVVGALIYLIVYNVFFGGADIAVSLTGYCKTLMIPKFCITGINFIAIAGRSICRQMPVAGGRGNGGGGYEKPIFSSRRGLPDGRETITE